MKTLAGVRPRKSLRMTPIEVVNDRTGERRAFVSPKPRWRIIDSLGFTIFTLNKPPKAVRCCLHAWADRPNLVVRVHSKRENATRIVINAVLEQGGEVVS